jgi:hypothetical protein
MNKKYLPFFLFMTIAACANAQWNNAGFNYTTDRIAIGTSTWSSKRLFVTGNDADHIAFLENTSASGYGLVLGAYNDPLRIVTPGNYSNYLLVVNGNGNVGIGNNTASYKLDVLGTVRSYGDLRTSGVAVGNGYYADDGQGSTIFSITRQANNEARFQSYGFHTFFSGSNTGVERMRIAADGKVGIGTPTPLGRLDINGAGSQLRLSGGTIAGGVWTNNSDILYLADWATGSKGINLNMTTGTVSIGSDAGTVSGYGSALSLQGASSNGDALWMARYNNGDNKSEFRVNIGDDPGQNEDMFVVGTHSWNGGTWFPHLAVQASGNVGIGTTTPDAKLTVKGDVHTREVRVDLNGAVGPDYVFEKNYNLLPLSQLETYINQNKHLPEVPSAKEMEENGLNLKEMNLILLKKVEELTLHLIEQQKQIDSQNQNISILNAQVRTLKPK